MAAATTTVAVAPVLADESTRRVSEPRVPLTTVRCAQGHVVGDWSIDVFREQSGIAARANPPQNDAATAALSDAVFLQLGIPNLCDRLALQDPRYFNLLNEEDQQRKDLYNISVNRNPPLAPAERHGLSRPVRVIRVPRSSETVPPPPPGYVEPAPLVFGRPTALPVVDTTRLTLRQQSVAPQEDEGKEEEFDEDGIPIPREEEPEDEVFSDEDEL